MVGIGGKIHPPIQYSRELTEIIFVLYYENNTVEGALQ